MNIQSMVQTLQLLMFFFIDAFLILSQEHDVRCLSCVRGERFRQFSWTVKNFIACLKKKNSSSFIL